MYECGLRDRGISVQPVTERRRSARVPLPPIDPAVPALHRLIDGDLVAARLQESLMPGSVVRSVRTERLVYRPGAGCRLTWAADVDGMRRIVAATSPRVATTLQPDGDDVLDAVVHWYPTDPALPALSEAEDVLRSWRTAHGTTTGTGPGELLSYRPGERAVIALGSTLGVLAPRPRGVDPERRISIQDRIVGRQLDHRDAASAAGDGAAILRSLHTSTSADGMTLVVDAQLRDTRSAATLAAAILPELASRVRRLVDRLEAHVPAGRLVVPSHGDFNVSQMIRRADGEIRVVDFDEHCLASPAYDLAGYVANVISGRPGDLERALAAGEVLVAAYGTRPADLDWYLAAAVLRRAPSPFRLQKRTWPERVTSIVEAAEAVMGA